MTEVNTNEEDEVPQQGELQEEETPVDPSTLHWSKRLEWKGTGWSKFWSKVTFRKLLTPYERKTFGCKPRKDRRKGEKGDDPPVPRVNKDSGTSPYRFQIGDFVWCKTGEGEEDWTVGKVMRFSIQDAGVNQENEWPEDMVAPYEIQLVGPECELIYAPADEETLVKAYEIPEAASEVQSEAESEAEHVGELAEPVAEPGVPPMSPSAEVMEVGELRRFVVGDRVQCKTSPSDWSPGRVVRLNIRDVEVNYDNDWPIDTIAPYEILLDDDAEVIYAPIDVDAVIRRAEPEEADSSSSDLEFQCEHEHDDDHGHGHEFEEEEVPIIPGQEVVDVGLARRFSVGDRVQCRTGEEEWSYGVITRLNIRHVEVNHDNGWPLDTICPYEIMLEEDGDVIYAPVDVDYMIQKVENQGRDFAVGDYVQCKTGLQEWSLGVIVRLNVQDEDINRKNGWPVNTIAPYEISLGGKKIVASEDAARLMRPVEHRRFAVGDHVQCKTGPVEWTDGVVVRVNIQDRKINVKNGWPIDTVAPYEIKLKGTGKMIVAPLDTPELMRAPEPQAESEPEPVTRRFSVGDQVQCKQGVEWIDGVVVRVNIEDQSINIKNNWPIDMVAPYEIKLEGGKCIVAPLDTPELMRAPTPQAESEPESEPESAIRVAPQIKLTQELTAVAPEIKLSPELTTELIVASEDVADRSTISSIDSALPVREVEQTALQTTGLIDENVQNEVNALNEIKVADGEHKLTDWQLMDLIGSNHFTTGVTNPNVMPGKYCV